MLSNIEQVMAKADLTLAENYAALSESPERAAEIFTLIKNEYLKSRQALLDILQTDELLSDNRSLTRSLALRIPYLNALGGLQVTLLKRLHKDPGKTPTCCKWCTSLSTAWHKACAIPVKVGWVKKGRYLYKILLDTLKHLRHTRA